MDLKVFFATFVTIFLAELGDKTQLAAFGLGASSTDIKAVLLGTFVALLLASMLGVFAGKYLGQFIDPKWVRVSSGSLFILLGALLLFDKMPR